MMLKARNCPVCFIEYAVPAALIERREREGGSWYCPNGHSLHFVTPEIDKIRLERDRLKQENARLADERRIAWATANEQSEQRAAAERSASALKGVATRMKNRVSNGVCPCCNRTFANLQKHMATKHAGFVAEEIAPDGVTVQ